MKSKRTVGIVLLVLGIILLIVGLNASGSFADSVSHTFTGKWTDKTAWYVYGGLALALIGAITAGIGWRRK